VVANRKDSARCVRQFAKVAALAVLLILSALLMAVAIRSTAYAGLAWISMVPIFWAIRAFCPLAASLSGVTWGVCIFLFAGATGAIQPTALSLGLLATVPMVYAGLCSLMTRAVGFNPAMLALSWILVEIALKPLGLDHGLLAGSQSHIAHLHWMAHLLGYVFLAFLVVCANASLVSVLSKARPVNIQLKVCTFPSFAIMPISARRWFSLLTFLSVEPLALRRVYARGPPGLTVCDKLSLWCEMPNPKP